jgi:hypothetical protein
MIMKKFTGYGPGWNRCECGLPLKRTSADSLVHLHGKYSVRTHDLVMRKKAEVAAKEAAARAEDIARWQNVERQLAAPLLPRG